jgi:hypothetical protein
MVRMSLEPNWRRFHGRESILVQKIFVELESKED